MSDGADTTAIGAARRIVDRVLHGSVTPAVAGAIESLSAGESGDVALRRLGSAFSLSAFERELLALLGLSEEHEAFAAIARQLHPLGEPWWSFGGIALVLDLDAVGRRHLHRSLSSGPLVRSRLVVPTSAAPLPERGWRLVDGLWEVVRGGDRWPDDAQPRRTQRLHSAGLPTTELMELVDAVDSRVVLVPSSTVRPLDEVVAHVADVLESAGRSVAVFAAESLTPEREAVALVHLLARGSLPVVVGTPEHPPFAAFPRPTIICTAPGLPVALDDRPAVELSLTDRTLGEDVAMWERLAPELNGDAERLAGLLRVDALRATRAVGDARASQREGNRPLDAASIVRHVRRRSDGRLPMSVRRVSPDVVRSRLVTTSANDTLLRSIVDRVRGQVQVLHDWRFADVGAQRGVRALFAGPPGTGKTLSAQVIASELGLDLLVVDLSALVSKWLGETEKNIGEVFDAAERCQAVLFFDEADAIFGKRTDAGDAQARWANLETAYLLSRIDTFEGLVVLATNLRANIDEAFLRRLDVVVDFDEPGIDERRRLWEGHLPAAAPLAGDVAPEELAALYPITGGLVRNAAIGAAFDCAARSTPIDQEALVDAIRREYEKAGRSFPGAPRVRPSARVDHDRTEHTTVRSTTWQ